MRCAFTRTGDRLLSNDWPGLLRVWEPSSRQQLSLPVANSGERISGHAPFGWDFGSGGRLMENAHEQKSIAGMQRLRAEGLSYRGTAVRLDNEGIRPKRSKRWIHTTVKNILSRNAA
jgi:hypothetical protein